jgi:hypothetical protein
LKNEQKTLTLLITAIQVKLRKTDPMIRISRWIMLFILFQPSPLMAKGSFVLHQLQQEVDIYDHIELEIEKTGDVPENPFTGVEIQGLFTDSNGKTDTLEGFCDDEKGIIYRVRYMPRVTGKFKYRLLIRSDEKPVELSGNFNVLYSSRKGPVQVDPLFPWHFVYAGTDQHYFWNATTAYWMMGWKDDRIIFDALDRLGRLGINRIRVAINGRSEGGSRWHEPLVSESANFTFLLNPWQAANPLSLDTPHFDVTRFNVAYWQKLDRLVDHALRRGIVVSLIFYVDGKDHGCDPFKEEHMGSQDEQRYYRYAVARYAGYPNIMWDIANEYHLFRSEKWVNTMGALIRRADPATHLISVHGNSEFAFRTAPWAGMVLYQSWDDCGGYQFISDCRKKQEATGRILPQANEEYGYEDHYPPWGCGEVNPKEPDGRSAENRRQLAWEIYMAGGYQTTGERANEAGCGGWINGMGNANMTMLRSFGLIRQIFEKTAYWKMSPRIDLVNFGNMCLANPGEEYIIYARVSNCRLTLPGNNSSYSVYMINPRNGGELQLNDTDPENKAWQYTENLSGDWVFLLKKK